MSPYFIHLLLSYSSSFWACWSSPPNISKSIFPQVHLSWSETHFLASSWTKTNKKNMPLLYTWFLLLIQPGPSLPRPSLLKCDIQVHLASQADGLSSLRCFHMRKSRILTNLSGKQSCSYWPRLLSDLRHLTSVSTFHQGFPRPSPIEALRIPIKKKACAKKNSTAKDIQSARG